MSRVPDHPPKIKLEPIRSLLGTVKDVEFVGTDRQARKVLAAIDRQVDKIEARKADAK